MDGKLLFGILVVSIVTYFLGKIFYAIVGCERGCIGKIVWGCLFIASILSGNWVIVVIYIGISLLFSYR